MTKIIFTVDYFDNTRIGGSEISFQHIIEKILHRRFDVVIYSRNAPKIKNKRARGTLKTVHVHERKVESFPVNPWPIDDLIHFFYLYKEFRREKPAVVLTQKSLSIPTIIASRMLHVPCLNFIRDVFFFCMETYGMRIEGSKLVNCRQGMKKLSRCIPCIWNNRKIQALTGNPAQDCSMFRKILDFIYDLFYNFIRSRIYTRILRLATLNIVASPLMKNIVKNFAKNVEILPITPVSFDNVDKDRYNAWRREFYERHGLSENDLKLVAVASDETAGAKGVNFI
ncbi:MAG: hypothetical protein ACTSRA_14665, partial [Promethearchaeota archaeon]